MSLTRPIFTPLSYWNGGRDVGSNPSQRRGTAVSEFKRGDRVYHAELMMYGTYQERHNLGRTSPETLSYVLFDGDPDYPDGRPVSTCRLRKMPSDGAA